MSSTSTLDRMERVPRWIVGMTGTAATIGLLLVWPWRQTGDVGSVRLVLAEGVMLVTALAGLGLLFSVRVARRFAPGEPMRRAWLLVAASAASQVVCGIVAQWMTLLSLRDGSLWSGGTPELLPQLWQLGLAFGGPIPMFFLAAGFFEAARAFQRSGVQGRFSRLDWTALVILAVAGLIPVFRGGSLLSMASGPILTVVAFEAYLILRSVLRMGSGLISKSWGALAIAVMCTTLGYLAMWGAFRALAWCLWFAAAAAFALGPAYQLAAARKAIPEE